MCERENCECHLISSRTVASPHMIFVILSNHTLLTRGCSCYAIHLYIVEPHKSQRNCKHAAFPLVIEFWKRQSKQHCSLDKHSNTCNQSRPYAIFLLDYKCVIQYDMRNLLNHTFVLTCSHTQDTPSNKLRTF